MAREKKRDHAAGLIASKENPRKVILAALLFHFFRIEPIALPSKLRALENRKLNVRLGRKADISILKSRERKSEFPHMLPEAIATNPKHAMRTVAVWDY